MNNRDHRKITVIDGKVGYTGGYNLANEYFHVTSPYGYWKDTGLRLEGDAVNSLTAMFLEMWNAIHSRDYDDTEVDQYFSTYRCKPSSELYCIPYADNPLDHENVGENVYMNILASATTYAYFITPYLVITDELSRALTNAAKRGVDVRIITPGIPDKAFIYQITRSYYAQLASQGVKIYEYTPGFCHAKMCVSDDHVFVVGTINLDYRSLYLHFENACLVYNHQLALQIREDFTDIMNSSTEVTSRYSNRRSLSVRLIQGLLRLIAPLT